MKSIALSFLVAVGLTLGAANAFAETPVFSVVGLSAAQTARLEANEHTRKANEFRAIARVETERARVSMKIALDDEKQGFMYEAGVQRAKAAQHMAAARAALQSAAREDALAAFYLSKAQQAESQNLGRSVAASAPRVAGSALPR